MMGSTSSGSSGTSSGGTSSGATSSSGAKPDAATDAVASSSSGQPDATVDAAVDTGPTRPCDVAAPFNAPTWVAELSTAANQDGARITPSGLELYLSREEPANYKQVHRYTRATPADPWGNDIIEAGLTVTVGTKSASYYLSFADETKAYLSVFQGDGAPFGSWKIQSTTRAMAGDVWGTPTTVANVAAMVPAGDEFPWINSAKDKLYFMSSRSGGYKLFMSAAVGSTFQAAMPLVFNTNSTANQYAPVVSKDGKTLYFAGSIQSNRRIFKATGAGGLDFSASTIQEPNLNIGTTNQLTWLSPDTCEAYMTIDGSIYKARKPN
jgi:WD40-like Beta Propeller Repeat